MLIFQTSNFSAAKRKQANKAENRTVLRSPKNFTNFFRF